MSCSFWALVDFLPIPARGSIVLHPTVLGDPATWMTALQTECHLLSYVSLLLSSQLLSSNHSPLPPPPMTRFAPDMGSVHRTEQPPHCGGKTLPTVTWVLLRQSPQFLTGSQALQDLRPSGLSHRSLPYLYPPWSHSSSTNMVAFRKHFSLISAELLLEDSVEIFC